MSRARVRAAIETARRGEVENAIRELREVRDPEALRLHLGRAITRGDSVAAELWTVLLGKEPPPTSSEKTATPQVATIPPRIVLENPAPLLNILAGPARVVRFGDAFISQVWGLVGLASLGRRPARDSWEIVLEGQSNGVLFAKALGFEQVIRGEEVTEWGEPGRTVKLRRIQEMRSIEPVADRISKLISPNDQVAQKTLHYVIVELLRNVLQHSQDPLGAVVAAQAMTMAQQYERPAVQVAVADTGIGILAHLRGKHPELQDAGAALEKALRAHISGTFEEGLTGSLYNAGFGLFAISELTKLTGGRLLLASRGAALSIQGNRDDPSRHSAALVRPAGTEYPGTLVAFELPLGDSRDFSEYMEQVKQRAKEQTPARAVHRWIRYSDAPPDARRLLVRVVKENTEQAAELGRQIRNNILAGDPVVLDFAGLTFVTQSFLHSLLFRALRIAWAEGHAVYALNVEPAVRSALEALEEYALGG